MATSHSNTIYRPSINGFKFKNEFRADDIMDEMYDVPTWMFPGSTWGLCGGMCFASLDRYFAEALPPDTATKPAKGDPLFKELAQRQKDAVNQVGWWTILNYQTSPDAGQADIGPIKGDWLQTESSLGHLTRSLNWPLVRAKIDAGIPTTICVIRSGHYNVTGIGGNHMVVVYAYQIDYDEGRVYLHVYDPNHPGVDGIRISFRFNKARSQLDAWQGTGEKVRGFLWIPYDRAEKVFTEETYEPGKKENLEYLWTLFG